MRSAHPTALPNKTRKNVGCALRTDLSLVHRAHPTVLESLIPHHVSRFMAETNEKNSTVSDQDVNALNTYAEKSLQAAQTSEVLTEAPSLIQQGAIYLIGAALIITLCLLYFGKVHVVVSAKGKVIPQGQTLRVQALEGGVAIEVLANVGDRLPAGAPILKLDVSESGLNLAELKRNLQLQESQLSSMQTSAVEIERILSDTEGFLTKERAGCILLTILVTRGSVEPYYDWVL